MRDELELKLAEQFPFMRKKESLQEQRENGGISDLYSAYGCQMGDGWYELMVDLCAEITAAYERAGVPVDIVVDQVKEKWGGLRFYYHTPDCPVGSHAFDIIGVGSLRNTGGDSPLEHEIAEIVSKYEEKSVTVCEDCGKPGTRRKLGYVRTLCDACFEKRLRRRP